MRSDVEQKMRISSEAFTNTVWPEISAMCGGGRLIDVETSATCEMRDVLDRMAGIDHWQVVDDKGAMRGIAGRVQPIPDDRDPWESFTIRVSTNGGTSEETEYRKRLRAIRERERGWLMPHLTVQAYVTTDSKHLRSVGVVQTTDLYEFTESNVDNWGCVRPLTNRHDGNRFYAVWWKGMVERGCNVKIKRFSAQCALFEDTAS